MRPCRGLPLLLLLASGAVLPCPSLAPARALPPVPQMQWLLATQNLWRLRDTRRDARYDDPVSPSLLDDRLQAQADYIRTHLGSPHLLAVQEVENRALLTQLAGRIAAAGGPAYRAYLLDGNDPSGIDVGVLVRDPVQVASAAPLFADRRFMGAPLFSRPPLLVELDAPYPWSVVVLHLRSGRGLHDSDRQKNVRDKRARQAQVLLDWARAHDRPVILVGDLNSAPDAGVYSQPLSYLLDMPLHSAWQALPPEERYSYRYRCQPQAIDHILYPAVVARQVQRVVVSRGNAGRHGRLRDSEGRSPVSDHDALGVVFRLPRQQRKVGIKEE